MAKIQDLKDDEILRFFRASVTESAAATFTQQEIDTQLSIERGYIWLIHFLEFFITPSEVDDPAQGTMERIMTQVTRESQSSILAYNDSDLIESVHYFQDRSATIGTDAGPAWYYNWLPKFYAYYPAIPYAAQSIYIGVHSTSSSAVTIYVRGGYTLKKVSDKFFFRVAQALIG